MNKTKKITLTGIMAAQITVMTAYFFHIPVGMNGGYIHFGDALIFLSATLLPCPYAMVAAAIGGGLADLLTAPMWIPVTVVVKMLLVPAFDYKAPKIITMRNMVALLLGYFISFLGYFLGEYLIFGTWAVLLVSMFNNFIQFVGSAVVFLVLGTVFDKAGIKVRFFYNE